MLNFNGISFYVQLSPLTSGDDLLTYIVIEAACAFIAAGGIAFIAIKRKKR